MARARAVLLVIMTVGTLSEVSRGSERKVYPYLDAALHHYDTLHTDHLSHTITFPHPNIHHRQVKFNTLGRNFLLHLSPNRKIFSSDFAAYVVDGSNNKERHPVDIDEFYHGYLDGEADSRVTAHVSKTGVLTATIRTQSECFHIEPSQDYIKRPHPFHMVAYQASDIKNRLASMPVDYVVAPDVPISDSSSNEEVQFDSKDSDELHLKSSFHSSDGGGSKSWNRLRRQTATVFRGRITGDSCSMVLVVDHTFYRQFGSSVDSVTRRVVSLISEIDTTIFRPTMWTNDVQEGFGLDIAKITIHSEPNSTNCSKQVDTCYYSQELENRNPEASDLLTAFNFGNWGSYCLAHLFTYRDFRSGLLGLANIASPLQGQTGGVCSRAFTDPNGRPALNIPANSRIIYNTGLSSYNSNGAPLVRGEEILVTAHELGHNWGSSHDPVNNEQCRTRFLMYQFAQDGSSPSHMMFSPCSRSSIGAVLLAKGNCFQARSTICGDYRIDEGEECDAGPDGDTCCNMMCLLREGSNCSDSNFPCCVGCQRTSTQVCRTVRPLSRDCTTSTMCEMDSLLCPSATPAVNGTPCLGGQCVLNIFTNRTTCVSQCELNNETSCSCTELNNECLLCCMEGTTCRPASGFNPLPNGSPCSLGTCFNGTCTEQVGQDTISRIWTAIITLDVNTILQFMLENIVGAVLIFTAVVWIPVSLIVHFVLDSKVLKRFRSAAEHTDHASWFATRADKLHKLHSKAMWEEMPLIHHAQEPPQEESPETESSPLVSSPVDTGPPPVYIHS